MASVATALKVALARNPLRVIGSISFAAGNYAAGGILADLSNLTGIVNRQPTLVLFNSKAGYQYWYDPATGKVRVNFTYGVEHTVAALNALVVADVIKFEAVYAS